MSTDFNAVMFYFPNKRVNETFKCILDQILGLNGDTDSKDRSKLQSGFTYLAAAAVETTAREIFCCSLCMTEDFKFLL